MHLWYVLYLLRDVLEYLTDKSCDIIERCLITSYAYGDKFSIDFWMVARHYLKIMKLQHWKHVQTATADPNSKSSRMFNTRALNIGVLEINYNVTRVILDLVYAVFVCGRRC